VEEDNELLNRNVKEMKKVE